MFINSKLYQRLILAFAPVLLVTSASSDALAKSWRDITPLHSNAEDVRRLLPGCEEKETGCYLPSEDHEVTVIYSGSKIHLGECKHVPKGTVLAVVVKLRSSKNVKHFKLKGERYNTFDPATPPKRGYKAYYYVREGLIINTYKGKAFQLVYIAAEKDIPLCPEYYNDPKGFVEVGFGHGD